MLEPAFHLAGASVSWLELLAFAFALAGVALTARVSVWGWPPTIIASVLYGALFFHHRLYGDAALQIFFVIVSAWGWRAWLAPATDIIANTRQGIRSLSRRATLSLVIALTITWLALGIALMRFTDTDVAWFDAAPTAGSLFAQVLLARKWIQAWPLWVGVNAVAIALFATKALWLTVVLYTLLLMLSIAGWLHWRRLLR